MEKKTALVLSGGGAKGAFQSAVEKYAREKKGYSWDIIAGVSVGALNGSMVAMQKGDRLFEFWNTITADQVYTGGFNFWSVLHLLFGARSFLGNQPLRKLLHQELELDKIQGDLRIGTVSLTSGEYVQFTPEDPNFESAIIASTAIPVVWSPEYISETFPEMVDGGVRNISPIGDVLEDQPDEIIIINCTPETPLPLHTPLTNILNIGLRTIDLMTSEIFQNDVEEFIRINDLVEEAGRHGVVLHNPKTGKPYRHFDYKLIEPEVPLADTLDFSQESIQKSIAEGFKRAREVFGR
jgi:NTE family protein